MKNQIKCQITGRVRPKLIQRLSLGSTEFLCEDNQIWDCISNKDGTVWMFCSHCFFEPNEIIYLKPKPLNHERPKYRN